MREFDVGRKGRPAQKKKKKKAVKKMFEDPEKSWRGIEGVG